MWRFVGAVAFAVALVFTTAARAQTIGPDLQLDDSGLSNEESGVAIVGSGTRFFAVWVDDRAAEPGIYGARMDTDGTVLDGSGILLSAGGVGEAEPAVGADGSDFLVAWVDSRSGTPKAACASDATAPDGTTCDDADTCTESDTCAMGICGGEDICSGGSGGSGGTGGNPPSDNDDDCSCTAVGRHRPGNGWMALLLFGAASAGRRRRSRR